jgi:uncharacterized protein (TIGR03437 family)
LNKFRLLVGTALFALLLGPTSASAQAVANLTVVSGNGQLICLGCFSGFTPGSFQPLVVRVVDANGNPISGAQVNWTSLGGFYAYLDTAASTSDVNGYAKANLLVSLPPQALPGGEILQYTATATAGNSSATFNLTQAVQVNPAYTGGFPAPPILVRVAPDGQSLAAGSVLSGQAGTTATPPIKVQVVTFFSGIPVPNVSTLVVNDQTPDVGPTITCQAQLGSGADVVLTDASGTATCNPVFGGKPNVSGTAAVSVGGAYPFEHLADPTKQATNYSLLPASPGKLSISVTSATVGSLQVVSGSGQSAQAGAALASPLVVNVLGTSGVGLSGQQVNWTVSPAGSATLGGAQTTTDSTGRTQNTVVFSSTASGTVTITAAAATDGTKTAAFTATAVPNVTVTALQIVSGNNQSAIVNTAFAAPLVVQLTATGGTPAGVPVGFTVSGSATVSNSSVNTDANGRAQVTVQAGASAGAATVTATAAGLSQTFNLTVSPPGPTLSANGFVNAADQQLGSLSPCSLAAVYGTGLAPGLTNQVIAGYVGPLPGVLANNHISVGAINAPLFSVGRNTAGQELMTFQVPCDVTPGSSVPVVVNVGAGNATVNIPIQSVSPGIFQTVMSDGVARAVVIRPDGSFVSIQNPGRRGEVLVALVTGLGPAVPAMGSNSVAAPGTNVTPQGTVIVGMAGAGVPLISATASPSQVGVWLVSFMVPSTVSQGNSVPFSISVIPAGGSNPVSSGPTSIPIQ